MHLDGGPEPRLAVTRAEGTGARNSSTASSTKVKTRVPFVSIAPGSAWRFATRPAKGARISVRASCCAAMALSALTCATRRLGHLQGDLRGQVVLAVMPPVFSRLSARSFSATRVGCGWPRPPRARPSPARCSGGSRSRRARPAARPPRRARLRRARRGPAARCTSATSSTCARGRSVPVSTSVSSRSRVSTAAVRTGTPRCTGAAEARGSPPQAERVSGERGEQEKASGRHDGPRRDSGQRQGRAGVERIAAESRSAARRARSRGRGGPRTRFHSAWVSAAWASSTSSVVAAPQLVVGVGHLRAPARLRDAQLRRAVARSSATRSRSTACFASRRIAFSSAARSCSTLARSARACATLPARAPAVEDGHLQRDPGDPALVVGLEEVPRLARRPAVGAVEVEAAAACRPCTMPIASS